jgi:hypothetical protein
MAWFAKDKKLGDLAEKKAYAFLKEAGFQPTIPEKVDEHHDIVLGDGRKVEVKFDVVMDSTRNLGIEWWSNRETGAEGWGQLCDAHILIQFYNMDNALVLDWPRFKAWLMRNRNKYPEKDTRNSKSTIIPVTMDDIPDSLEVPEVGKLFTLKYDLARWEVDAIRGRRHKIEIAKSSRCNCVSCGNTIAKGETKIGKKANWYHVLCAASENVVAPRSILWLKGIGIFSNDAIDQLKQDVAR